MAKPKPKKYVSPQGTAYYPRVNKADTEYNANGIFHTKLRMDSDDPVVAKFLKQIDTWHDESMAAFKEELKNSTNPKLKSAAAKKKAYKDGDKPYVYEVDDEGEDTNIVLVNFKMAHNVPKKDEPGEFWTFTPTFVDSHGNVIKGQKPLVYGGSVLKIRYVPIQWSSVKLGASVKLRMDAVQIIELVTAGGESAEGFGDEGDGFDAADAEDAGFDDESSTAGTAGGGGDEPADGEDDGDF